MSNFTYDREIVEYHRNLAKHDIRRFTDMSQDSPDFTAALRNAENRLRFWMNATIRGDDVWGNK